VESLAELLHRPTVSWSDLLDIALVSFLIYELLLLIRGTRAVQMALSGGFLIGLFFLSDWLQLETVNWVIRNLSAYVVVAIIVLFQSDIRRALAHFGRARFFRYFERATSTDETLEELGTRHRAASGLTEENDAVAVVVSEETGIISLAIAGDLERRLTADTLRIRLRALLGGRRSGRINQVRSRDALV